MIQVIWRATDSAGRIEVHSEERTAWRTLTGNPQGACVRYWHAICTNMSSCDDIWCQAGTEDGRHLRFLEAISRYRSHSDYFPLAASMPMVSVVSTDIDPLNRNIDQHVNCDHRQRKGVRSVSDEETRFVSFSLTILICVLLTYEMLRKHDGYRLLSCFVSIQSTSPPGVICKCLSVTGTNFGAPKIPGANLVPSVIHEILGRHISDSRRSINSKGHFHDADPGRHFHDAHFMSQIVILTTT